MKKLKKFQDFINEGKDESINDGFKATKPKFEYLFQIHAREKDKDGNRENHQVQVNKGDNFNDVKKKVLDDYPASKYFYNVFQTKGTKLIKIGTNESENLDEILNVNENNNPEGDAKVLSFIKRLAKEWDIPVEDAASFIKQSIKRNGY